MLFILGERGYLAIRFEYKTAFEPDLEKVASGASGACRHFVGNHALLQSWKKLQALQATFADTLSEITLF